MPKLTDNLRGVIEETGLKDGMCISFHHHLRNGDRVLNMVMDTVAEMGIRNLTVNASSLLDVHLPIIDHIKNGVVTAIETNYIAPKLGCEISKGILEKPVIFRSHGGRAGAIDTGVSSIVVFFISAC